VAELPLNVQAGLLRALQERRFFRLGGSGEVEADVRVVAATNRDVRGMITDGLFREDLFYRLNVVNIHIPPLCERKEDIPPIAEAFQRSRSAKLLSSEQLDALKGYDWPGNVRELLNILERALVLKERDFEKLMIRHRQAISSPRKPRSELLDDVVRDHAKRVYEKHGRNKTRTAKTLGISVNTLKKHLSP
ncbi:MAG: two-component system response regulator, partial [Kiritimatiellaeota bacterium]|nr:two-component system response regulator [Kiritimatiellota bacterium]